MKKIIATSHAPAALGPYSQATVAGGMLFISGQLGIDPATGDLPPDVEGQAKQSLANLRAILKEAGATPAHVVKTTVFLASMDDFAAVNKIYSETFGENPPARSCIAVAALPKAGLVEVEAIAILPA